MRKSDYTAQVKRVVAEWAECLEGANLSSKHPIQAIREIALAEVGTTDKPLTARGTETRKSARPPAMPVNPAFIHKSEAERIIDAVRLFNLDGVKACYLIDGLGLSEKDAGKVMRRSRPWIRENRARAFGAIEMALFTRIYSG